MTGDRVESADETVQPASGRRWANIIGGGLVLAVFVYAGRGYYGELARLSAASPAMILAMVATLLVARVIAGATQAILLKRLGHRVGLGEMFLLNVLMTYTNLLLPSVGVGTPAIYLKYRRGVAYTEFSATILLVAMLQVAGIGILGSACQVAIRLTSHEPVNKPVLLLFAIAGVGGILATVVRIPLPPHWQGRIAALLRRLISAHERLGSGGGLVVTVLSMRIALLALRAVRLYFAFEAIGQEVPFAGIVLATMLGELAVLVSITPSGLGFREAAVTYGASLVGADPAVALSAAILDRLVMTLSVALIAQLAVWRLIRPVSRSPHGNTIV